jgi:hypothetical protein
VWLQASSAVLAGLLFLSALWWFCVLIRGAGRPYSHLLMATGMGAVSMILDLWSAANRVSANLTMEQLQSDTRDRAAYSTCQNVAAAAHQLDSTV